MDCSIHRVYINLFPLYLAIPFNAQASEIEIKKYAAEVTESFTRTLQKDWTMEMEKELELLNETSICKHRNQLNSRYKQILMIKIKHNLLLIQRFKEFYTLWVLYGVFFLFGVLFKGYESIWEYYQLIKNIKTKKGLFEQSDKKCAREFKIFFSSYFKHSIALIVIMNGFLRSKHILKFIKNKDRLPKKKIKQASIAINKKFNMLKFEQKFKLRPVFDALTVFKTLKNMPKKTSIFLSELQQKMKKKSKKKILMSERLAEYYVNSLLNYTVTVFNQKYSKYYLHFDFGTKFRSITDLMLPADKDIFFMYLQRFRTVFQHCVRINYNYLRNNHTTKEYAKKIAAVRQHPGVLNKVCKFIEAIRKKNNKNRFQSRQSQSNNIAFIKSSFFKSKKSKKSKIVQRKRTKRIQRPGINTNLTLVSKIVQASQNKLASCPSFHGH